MSNPFGMLDDLAKKATDALSDMAGIVQDQLAPRVMGMIPGGLKGMITEFESKGLGGIIRSWVGTGPNEPITAAQVIDGLGRERVEKLAGMVGVSVDTIAAQLSKVLPGLVDALTPDGTVPDAPPSSPPPPAPPPATEL
ncbi:MAG: YidB family protein [Gemmatimonadaceae bacterium]|nr:YidB family protein [Gemmatimonadaceae bacterium]